MKVLIAIPALDQCGTDFTLSLAAMLTKRAYDKKFSREVDIGLACAKGTIIPHSRNLLTQQAQDAKATHILFLDSDMCFPPDTLNRLINHHVAIVGADYVRRVPPHQLNGRALELGQRPNGLKVMASMPFGLMLINMKVFDAMEKPYFSYREGVTDQDTLSEDTYWCNEARRLGHTIWMDPQLTREVGHIGTSIFRPGA